MFKHLAFSKLVCLIYQTTDLARMQYFRKVCCRDHTWAMSAKCFTLSQCPNGLLSYAFAVVGFKGQPGSPHIFSSYANSYIGVCRLVISHDERRENAVDLKRFQVSHTETSVTVA